MSHTPHHHHRSAYFPEFYAAHNASNPDAPAPTVTFADIGCGFGGLLVQLSPLYPDKLILGKCVDGVFVCMCLSMYNT